VKLARLKKFRGQPILPNWEGEVATERLMGTRRILLAALDELIALGTRGTPEAAQDVLGRAIGRLNELDNEDQFICTIEREDLCDWLYDVGELCGLDADEEWVEEYREW